VGRGVHPPENGATVQPPGCTLAAYAAEKRLPPEFLQGLGVTDARCASLKAIQIPYRDEQGVEVAVRFRTALLKTSADRFRWRRGDKPRLYGLWRLGQARTAGYVVLVEGESDCHTLWFQEIPALGVPGADTWRDEWAAALDGIAAIYVVIEPDRGGVTLLQRLGRSPRRDKLRLIRLEGAKDVSELYLSNPSAFTERWQAAVTAATPWTEQARADAQAEARTAWERCASLAQAPAILDRFAEALAAAGVAGERRAAQLVYLVVLSRLLERPVSAAVKGPSAAGKSHLVKTVLEFFPPHAAYVLTAMSERVLAYSTEPLSHRVLVLIEAAGLNNDFTNYLVRSLLSEDRLAYETVEKTKTGLVARRIVREGPTGLLVTTTEVKLHDENETRLFSIPVTDTPAQTKNVIREIAKADSRPPLDLTSWHALQDWLETRGLEHGHRVVVPYAPVLAELIPPLAVRLRRDVMALITLIKAHALLHQASRDEAGGAIIATIDDYAVVHRLVADLFSDGIDATVSPTVRETVEAVRGALDDCPVGDDAGVRVMAVALRLNLDKSAASRRVRAAREAGYLQDLESRPGRPARLVLGDKLPDETEILPTPEALKAAIESGCTVAGDRRGITASLSPAASA